MLKPEGRMSAWVRVRLFLCLATAFAVYFSGALLAPAGSVQAQSNDQQIVDSLDAAQRKIEALVGERLAALMPQRTYVLRAMVLGHKVMLPRGSTSASSAYQLPGFQPSSGQAVPSEEKYVVDQVIVRIVLNDALSPEDIQYLRTIVPILADFRPERGDRLDLQALPAFGHGPALQPGTSQAGQAAQPGAQPGAVTGEPGSAQPSGQGPESGGLFPFPGAGGRPLTTVDWIFIGLLGLILLAILIVLLRVFLMRSSGAPGFAAPAYAGGYGAGGYGGGYAPMPAAASGVRGATSRAGMEEPTYGLEADELEQRRVFDGLKSATMKTLFARPDLGRLMIQEWQTRTDKLALLIHALGPQVARQALLPPLGLARYRDLEEDVRTEKKAPDLGKMINVLKEANLYLISQELEHPEEIKADPFGFLDGLSRGQVGHLVKDEPVKVKAIVLSRMRPEDMAKILETYPKDVQLEIAVNIGNLHSLPLDMLDGVARDLAEKARGLPDARTVDIEGPTALVDMMGQASADTSLYLLQAMKAKDRALAEAVEKRFFVFDAIPLVPDDVLPQAVRGMPSGVVVQALQGSPQDLQRKVLMAFPEQARPGLVNSLRASKAAPEQIEEARRQVVARFQLLARQGKINLKQISDAWQAQAKPGAA